ncbi:SPOR domain-containing protein [uncultured Erythrobacter sp.]|uniref:SPOR domain-containing protein n=1 Tax=uncultured Erythrobacter sp. TaxID=263913 RepID=UPI002613B4B7|nr:SPOR domain-containing protein [uncultured Erythrobacter sp.]
MARRNKGFTGPKIGLFMSTALASLALAGCAGSAPPAELSFNKAQAALEDGHVDRAITHAEAAVLAEPRNAAYRAMLGAAYLESGRFQSAATAFGDAIELGDSDPRTVLSYALAQVASGNNSEALNKLSQHEAAIPSADLGLALALAGQPERGVHYLINTVRNGENSAKARQNLAYAYALAGNWRAARVMAAEDVPVDQLDTRLSDWAATARPEDYQVRVANLLGVSPVSDGGQPQMLALANFPSQTMMVAEAQDMRAGEVNADIAPQVADASAVETAPVPASVAAPRANEAPALAVRESNELRFQSNPVVQTVDGAPTRVAAAPSRAPARVAPRVASSPAPAPADRPAPAARPAPVSMPAAAAAPSRGAPRFVSNAVVQSTPVPATTPERAAPAPQRRSAVATGSSATHLVQLGSFSSRSVAEAKWREIKSRFPQLADHDVVITEAVVNGRTFFRVAAAGFGARSARSLCNTVKSAGRACFAYAASSPPAGAVDRGVRIAARTR